MREDMGHESSLLNKQPADRDLTGAFTPQHVAPMILRGSFNLSVGSPHSKLPLRSPGIECFLQKLNQSKRPRKIKRNQGSPSYNGETRITALLHGCTTSFEQSARECYSTAAVQPANGIVWQESVYS